MASSRFAYRNWAWESGATITASSEATGYPASNLRSPASWKIWRSTATTGDQWVKIDLGQARALTGCLLRYALLHAGGTVHFQANATDSWGAPTINTAFTVPATSRTRVLALFFASQSLRWVRIYFTNTAVVSQAVELGVVFPTETLTMPRKVRHGMLMGVTDLSLQVPSLSGQQQTDRRPQRFDLSIDPNDMEATTRDALLDLVQLVGTHTPIFVVVEDDNPNLAVYGRFVGGVGFKHVPHSMDWWTAPFTFQEDL